MKREETFERQIYKKPKHKLDGYCCPKCNKLVYKYVDKCCSVCGQKIDWSKYTK